MGELFLGRLNGRRGAGACDGMLEPAEQREQIWGGHGGEQCLEPTWAELAERTQQAGAGGKGLQGALL